MSRITIEVSDGVRERLAEKAARLGYDSIETFLEAAFTELANRSSLPDPDETDPVRLGGPPSVSVSSRKELEALLLSRMDEEGSFEPDEAFYQRLMDRATYGPPVEKAR